MVCSIDATSLARRRLGRGPTRPAVRVAVLAGAVMREEPVRPDVAPVPHGVQDLGGRPWEQVEPLLPPRDPGAALAGRQPIGDRAAWPPRCPWVMGRSALGGKLGLTWAWQISPAMTRPPATAVDGAGRPLELALVGERPLPRSRRGPDRNAVGRMSRTRTAGAPRFGRLRGARSPTTPVGDLHAPIPFDHSSGSSAVPEPDHQGDSGPRCRSARAGSESREVGWKRRCAS